MKKMLTVFSVLCLMLGIAAAAHATNGTNLIGIGPIARSMGGVGIAAPQDAISAVFANPAAMCFGAYCPGSEFNFSGSLFMPKVKADVTQGANTYKADSDDKVYAIPAIGISAPIIASPRPLRFGLAAYGVSGLGVDYRDTNLDSGTVAGTYSQLQIMKFAPALAYQVLDNLSIGLAVHVDYSSLDLGSGSSFGYGVGVQAGVIYRPTDILSLGLNYVSPQNVSHANVIYDPSTGQHKGIDLESPQQFGFGAAVTLFDKLLVEGDVKWLNWSDAKGYDDFDWNDQWVFALGTQYEVIPKLFLRAGYNYAKNPVDKHNGWSPTESTNVQGVSFPNPAYEEFRIIGLPAIVEHHITAGIGYEFSPKFAMNLGYVHAFENNIKESGTGFFGPETLKSTLSEDSLDFGLTWRF
jgi:long-chain fatty acid transport protein